MEQENRDFIHNDISSDEKKYQENFYQDYTAQYMNSQMNSATNSDNQNVADGSGDGFSIASLVLGIISILTCCCCLLGLIFGVLGLVFALIAKKGRAWDGMKIAGLICSIIGLILSFGVMIRMLIPLLFMRGFYNLLNL